jgi:precorrin-6x reductase
MNKIPSVTIRRLTFQPSIFWTFISFLTGKKRSSARKENIQDRNHRMLAETEPDLIIAFGAGESTETLLQEARDRGIEVIEVDVPVNHVHPTLD